MTRNAKAASTIALALSLGLLVQALVTTSFWRNTANAFRAIGTPYKITRTITAYMGFPMEELKARLEAALPGDQPVRLGPNISRSDFLRQRLTEALYPRPITPDSPHMIEFTGGKGIALASENSFEGQFPQPMLVSPTAKAPRSKLKIDYDLPFSIFELLACVLVATGYIALFASLRRRYLPRIDAVALAAALPCATFSFATAASLGTWLPGNNLQGSLVFVMAKGFVGLSVAIYLFVRHGVRLTVPRTWARRPENWALLVFLATLLMRALYWPISLWDGRSIWLFHAKQMAATGAMPRADILNPDLLWSHPDYPLLVPSWLSFFGRLGASFNERQAAMGLAILCCSLIVLVWILSRARLGRLAGSVFTVALALGTDHVNSGGYADGLLLLQLSAACLAFLDERPILAFILLGAASLTKAEGLVFAVIIAACLARPTVRRMPVLLLALLPGVLHKLWIKSLGIDSVLKDNSLMRALTDFFPRLTEALRLAPALLTSEGYTHVHALIWAGILGGIAVLTTVVVLRKRPSGLAAALLLAAVLELGFAFGSISFLPEQVDWFVSTALDRLLLEPAMLLVLTAFVLTRSVRPKESHGAPL